MIIFDLDGTLADCEHRRHFVVKPEPECTCDPDGPYYDGQSCMMYDYNNWKPDWKSFYEACDQDKNIQPVLDMFRDLCREYEIQIWSGRCESVRDKTLKWLKQNCYCFDEKQDVLKMRPIGDNTPDDELKERWLDEYIFGEKCPYPTIKDAIPCIDYLKKPIEFVFDSHPKSIEMWRRRGIFVFNCAQHDEEF